MLMFLLSEYSGDRWKIENASFIVEHIWMIMHGSSITKKDNNMKCDSSFIYIIM